MSFLIDWIARRVWFSILWFMRRPPVKRLRLTYPKYLPARNREKAWESFRSQEKWARRYGLIVMKWTVGVFVIVIFIQLVGALVYTMQANEMLRASPE